MIKLFFKILKSFIKQEKTLTLLIVLGMIVCNISILFFTNAYFSDLDEASKKEKEQNQVGFIITKDLFGFDETANLFSGKDFVQNWSYRMAITPDNMSIDIIAYGRDSGLDKKQFLAGENITNNEECKFVCSEKFNQSFFSKYGVMITVGYQLELNDVLLECSGIVASNDFDLLVPMSTFGQIDVSEINLTYYFKNNASQIEVEKLNSEIIEVLNPINVIRNERVYKYSFNEFLDNISNIIVFLIIAVLNYMFIYAYIINSRNKIYSILKIEGLTTPNLAIFALSELFILHNFAVICAMLIYLPFVCMKISVIAILTQTGYMWGLMAIINVVLYLVISLPEVIKQPIVLYREAWKK